MDLPTDGVLVVTNRSARIGSEFGRTTDRSGVEGWSLYFMAVYVSGHSVDMRYEVYGVYNWLAQISKIFQILGTKS